MSGIETGKPERGPDEREHGASGHGHHGDADVSKLGMWLFLFSEILLFGTLFLVFAVYLHMYPIDFRDASAELSIPIGAMNTLVLLTSSLTMALAIAALAGRRKKLCMLLLAVTVLLAFTFLTIKGFEWDAKFHHGIYPKSPDQVNWPPGRVVFFGLYFLMTGLHGLHVVIGAGVILAALLLVRAGGDRDRTAFVSNTGLYWHLVDVVWIFLFPLFYLTH